MDKKKALMKAKTALRKKMSIRKKVNGTTERPRMCVNKTLKNISVQVIDDSTGKTVCGVSTLSASVKSQVKTETRKNIDAAKIVGVEIAKLAIDKGVKKVVFDRAGKKYHGVVKAVADSARETGLEF